MIFEPQWLRWARELQALAQTGSHFATSDYDRDRYNRISEIAAEIFARQGDKEGSEILTIFSADSGYATPKVDVRVATFRDNRILLVRELEDGHWTLPGGWADVGEPPSVAAAREVREESGYEVHITKLAALFDRNLHGHPAYSFHAYKFFFLGELRGGSAQDSHETADAEFFAEDARPPLSLSRVTPGQVAHMFEHFRQPTLPTSFD